MTIENLFATPLLRVEEAVGSGLRQRCLAALADCGEIANAGSGELTHTQPVRAQELPQLAELLSAIEQPLVDFGFLLFGENLEWSVKELWLNRLSSGGYQGMHNHANSFISGIIYLSQVHPSAHTVFHRAMGGQGYVFCNTHSGSAITPYNAERWVATEVRCGDMILFPSYLLHAVPTNQGEERITLAFNAVPRQLQSYDYQIGFN